jgi:hypothetical protein
MQEYVFNQANPIPQPITKLCHIQKNLFSEERWNSVISIQFAVGWVEFLRKKIFLIIETPGKY